MSCGQLVPRDLKQISDRTESKRAKDETVVSDKAKEIAISYISNEK